MVGPPAAASSARSLPTGGGGRSTGSSGAAELNCVTGPVSWQSTRRENVHAPRCSARFRAEQKTENSAPEGLSKPSAAAVIRAAADPNRCSWQGHELLNA